MRTVHLVTRHDDLARVAPVLDRHDLRAAIFAPERLADDDANLRVDVALLDLRDLPSAAFGLLHAAYTREGAITFAVVGDENIDRVAVDSAVDDLVVMPAGAAEFAKRIERAIFKKHGVDSENFVRCGALALDLSNYRVTVDGESIVLTFKEYELLRFLAMNAGRVHTREQLLNRVWGYDYFGGARTVDVHIRRIRSKIEIRGHSFIETVRNVGYRLVAEARKDEVAE
jgi:DNA-binding response OmpR family regulator